MYKKIVFLAFIAIIANANIVINNTTLYEASFHDLTANTICPIKPNAATSIVVNDDYSLSCAGKENEATEVTHPLPHSVKITKDSAPIEGCISTLPKDDLLVYIKNTGTSSKPVIICKNFPPV